jgi:hypothetical protein
VTLEGGLLLQGGTTLESHLGRSSAVGVFERRHATVRPWLQAPVTAPTRSTGPSAPVLLRMAAAQLRRAPPMVGSARGSLKRFDDGGGLKGNGGSVLGSRGRGGVAGQGLYRGKPLAYG